MIYNILDRYNAGDLTALNKVQGAYGDFTNTPTTLAEAQQKLIDAENLFMSLPLEVRKEFNHSTSEFLASIANGEIENKLAKFGVKKEVEEVQPGQPAVQQPVTNQVQGGNSNE